MIISNAAAFAWVVSPGGSLGGLARKRVTQCALSRVCGWCGTSLGRPIAFVGTPDEVARNLFHAPPLHVACGAALLAADGAVETWQQIATSGFEYVRPVREDADPHPRFVPNSLL